MEFLGLVRGYVGGRYNDLDEGLPERLPKFGVKEWLGIPPRPELEERYPRGSI